MNSTNEHDREKAAFDALLVAAFRQDSDAADCPPAVVGPEPILNEEDQRALDALGSELVSRIVAGTWDPPSGAASASNESVCEKEDRELAGAFHRGEEDQQLTDTAREEIERRIRELDLEEEEEEEGGESAE